MPSRKLVVHAGHPHSPVQHVAAYHVGRASIWIRKPPRSDGQQCGTRQEQCPGEPVCFIFLILAEVTLIADMRLFLNQLDILLDDRRSLRERRDVLKSMFGDVTRALVDMPPVARALAEGAGHRVAELFLNSDVALRGEVEAFNDRRQ